MGRLTPIVELGVAEAFAILTEQLGVSPESLPPLDAIENEDWGRDLLLGKLQRSTPGPWPPLVSRGKSLTTWNTQVVSSLIRQFPDLEVPPLDRAVARQQPRMIKNGSLRDSWPVNRQVAFLCRRVLEPGSEEMNHVSPLASDLGQAVHTSALLAQLGKTRAYQRLLGQMSQPLGSQVDRLVESFQADQQIHQNLRRH